MPSAALMRHAVEGAAHVVAPFAVREESHPAWRSNHPSGFDTVSSVADGNLFLYSAERMATSTAHLPDTTAETYGKTVVNWWAFSALGFTQQLEPVTVITNFALTFPNSFLLLAYNPLVLEGRVDLVTWFCASRRP